MLYLYSLPGRMTIFQQFVSSHLDIVHPLLSLFKISHQTLQYSTATSTVIVECNKMISEESLQLKWQHSIKKIANLVQVESCSKELVALQNSCPSWRSCWSFGHSNHSSLLPLLFHSATSALLWRPQQKRAADLDSAGVTWTSSEVERQQKWTN